MALIEGLRKRGVQVRILTAALAATDAPVVHVGYSKYRPGLLAAGVELYELRPEFAPEGPHRRSGPAAAFIRAPICTRRPWWWTAPRCSSAR